MTRVDNPGESQGGTRRTRFYITDPGAYPSSSVELTSLRPPYRECGSFSTGVQGLACRGKVTPWLRHREWNLVRACAIVHRYNRFRPKSIEKERRTSVLDTIRSPEPAIPAGNPSWLPNLQSALGLGGDEILDWLLSLTAFHYLSLRTVKWSSDCIVDVGSENRPGTSPRYAQHAAQRQIQLTSPFSR